MMAMPVRTMRWSGDQDPEPLLTREWLVTNGRGGYASGSVAGVPTRRFHGLLVAALPTPIGRAMMLNHLFETVRLPDAPAISLGGYDSDRKPFIYVDFLSSAWGGRAWADGLDGNTNMMANLASQPAEICERETPLEILAIEFIQDAGGPGKYRGGMSVRRDYRFLEEEAVLQVRADRFHFQPYGLYGGQPGRLAGGSGPHPTPDPATPAPPSPPPWRRCLRRVRSRRAFRWWSP